MPKALPRQPNIDWLKKTAKERLAELRVREPATKLADAQLALAREYGFASWRALKARVDALSIDGRLLAAATQGDSRTLDELLAANPRQLMMVSGTWKRPLLHHAAEHGHADCVDVLLRRGFPVDTRDTFDTATALHWAAGHGHIAVAARLLAAGADIDGVGDAHEIGVIGWATCFRQTFAEMAEWLLARGAKPTIFAAVALGRDDLVRALIAQEPALRSRPMSKFEHYRSPLHLAVIKNQPRIVAILLELGADAHAKDARGHTPLSEATRATDAEIPRLLIAAGADAKDATLNHFHAVTPILNVQNVVASIAYYRDKLGFTLEWDWGDPPTFACVSRDNVRIFFCENGQGSSGTWLSIFVADVDALYEDYQRRGAIIRQAPANFPWGVREMNVADLDGHRLRIGGDATGPADGAHLDEGA